MNELTIPCRVDDKPLGLQPMYLTIEDDYSGAHGAELRPDFAELSRNVPAVRGRWKCPHCKMLFFRRKPCENHMGLTADKKVTCRILIDADDARRVDRAFAHNGFQEKT